MISKTFIVDKETLEFYKDFLKVTDETGQQCIYTMDDDGNILKIYDNLTAVLYYNDNDSE